MWAEYNWWCVELPVSSAFEFQYKKRTRVISIKSRGHLAKNPRQTIWNFLPIFGKRPYHLKFFKAKFFRVSILQVRKYIFIIALHTAHYRRFDRLLLSLYSLRSTWDDIMFFIMLTIWCIPVFKKFQFQYMHTTLLWYRNTAFGSRGKKSCLLVLVAIYPTRYCSLNIGHLKFFYFLNFQNKKDFARKYPV